MLKTKAFPIARIYVPVKRRATLDPAKVARIAGSILESGQETPIMVREDGERLVLVEGMHRLEACEMLSRLGAYTSSKWPIASIFARSPAMSLSPMSRRKRRFGTNTRSARR